jgi:hypothetical protein
MTRVTVQSSSLNIESEKTVETSHRIYIINTTITDIKLQKSI